MEDNNDQVQEDIQEDETSTEQSTETNEPITPEKVAELAQKAAEIAKGTQKGYTLTRQEIAEIKENQARIEAALEEIKSQRIDDFDLGDEEEKPITKKDLVEAIAEMENRKVLEQQEKEAEVDRLVEDLKVEGVVNNDAEADNLIQFTLDAAKRAGLKEISPEYILSVVPAWEKVKEAEAVKAQTAQKEAGKKVGNSEKTSGKSEYPSYRKIHNVDFDEL